MTKTTPCESIPVAREGCEGGGRGGADGVGGGGVEGAAHEGKERGGVGARRGGREERVREGREEREGRRARLCGVCRRVCGGLERGAEVREERGPRAVGDRVRGDLGRELEDAAAQERVAHGAEGREARVLERGLRRCGRLRPVRAHSLAQKHTRHTPHDL